MLLKDYFKLPKNSRNLTVEELAKKINKSRTALYQYANGSHAPRPAEAWMIEHFTNGKVPIRDLYLPFKPM